MKKLLAISLVMILSLGFSVAAFAGDTTLPSETATVAKGDTKITIGGELRFRGEFLHNTKYQLEDGKLNEIAGYKKNDTNGHGAYYDGRVRLHVDAKVSDTVRGFIELESGDNTHDTYVWGANSASGATGLYPEGNTKTGGMTLRQAWINYEKGGYGVKVGHQLLKLGNGLFYDHTKYGDDAIVVYANPTKFAHLGLIAIKHQEHDIYKADDANAYVALGAYKGQNWGVSGDVTYVDYQQPFGIFNYIHLWNFGLRGDVTFKPVTVRADLNVQTGAAKDKPEKVSIDFRGWSGLLGVDAKLGPAVLTLEGAMGSGDDTSKWGSDKVKSFVTSLGKDQHYTYVYEYRVKSACSYYYLGEDGKVAQLEMYSSGLCNTTYVKLGAQADIVPKVVDGNLYLYWLRATHKVALNGNFGKESSNLGWEIDARINYNFAKNLQYFVEGGYMFTGSAYDHPFDVGRSDAYAVRNGIELKF